MKKIGYRKEIGIISSVILLMMIFIGTMGIKDLFLDGECVQYHYGKTFRCLEIAFFGDYQHLMLMLLATVVVLLALLAFKESAYRAWFKFAIVYLPLAALWIIKAKEYGSGGFLAFDILSTREQVTFFVSAIFLIISFLIIIYKTLWGVEEK